MSTDSKDDPQSLDNYIPLHSRLTKKDYKTMAMFGLGFLPIGLLMTRKQPMKARALASLTTSLLGVYSGHCVVICVARESIDSERRKQAVPIKRIAKEDETRMEKLIRNENLRKQVFQAETKRKEFTDADDVADDLEDDADLVDLEGRPGARAVPK